MDRLTLYADFKERCSANFCLPSDDRRMYLAMIENSILRSPQTYLDDPVMIAEFLLAQMNFPSMDDEEIGRALSLDWLNFKEIIKNIVAERAAAVIERLEACILTSEENCDESSLHVAVILVMMMRQYIYRQKKNRLDMTKHRCDSHISLLGSTEVCSGDILAQFTHREIKPIEGED